MRKLLYLTIVISILFAGCKKESGTPQKFTVSEGVYIINQGGFNAANASLSYFQPADGKQFDNLFTTVNNVPLGDVAQSMAIAGDLAYIVINNSGLIYGIDRWTAEHKGTINGLSSPRNMLLISNDKAYVSDLYSNDITIVNPSTYEKTGSIPVNRSTEEMVMSGSNVFVAHWSGFSQALTNNKVLVIDAGHDTMIDSITVGIEPNSMVLDKNSHIWVLCSGGYDNIEIPSLWKIDAATFNVIDTLFFPEAELNPSGLKLSGAGDAMFFLNNGVFKMSVNDTKLPDAAFIKQDSGRYFMALGVDPENGDIYTSNPLDYQQNGIVYRFDAGGTFIEEMETGIVPGAFGFNYR